MQPRVVISYPRGTAKTVYLASKRDLRKRGALPDMACGVVNPCLQASENGGAAARRGEAAFASGCTEDPVQKPELTPLQLLLSLWGENHGFSTRVYDDCGRCG